MNVASEILKDAGVRGHCSLIVTLGLNYALVKIKIPTEVASMC